MLESARFGSAIDDLQGSGSHSSRVPRDDITIHEIATARSIGREPSAGQTFAAAQGREPTNTTGRTRPSFPVAASCELPAEERNPSRRLARWLRFSPTPSDDSSSPRLLTNVGWRIRIGKTTVRGLGTEESA